MTTIDSTLVQTLRTRLSDQFEQQTAELTTLTGHRTDPGRNGSDPETLAPLIDSIRQSLADTTEALRRIAEGTYGSCQTCQRPIAPERLEILPQARFCVPCQQARDR